MPYIGNLSTRPPTLGRQAYAERTSADQLTGTTKFAPLPDVNNILVTGGAGFIGNWLTRHLTLNYGSFYKIVCYDRTATAAPHHEFAPSCESLQYTSLQGDITNLKRLLQILRQHDIDAVIHVAASTLVQHCSEKPFDITQNNVVSTQTLLEAARIHGKIQRFMHISPSDAFVEPTNSFITNKGKMRLLKPYYPHRAAAEIFVDDYCHSYQIPCMVVRGCNYYGPSNNVKKMLSRLVRVSRSQRLTGSHASGDDSTHSYLYASDAVDAFDTIFHLGTIGSTYNLLTSDERSSHLPATPIRSDNKLINLGWTKKVNPEQGLKATIHWYLQNTTQPTDDDDGDDDATHETPRRSSRSITHSGPADKTHNTAKQLHTLLVKPSDTHTHRKQELLRRRRLEQQKLDEWRRLKTQFPDTGES